MSLRGITAALVCGLLLGAATVTTAEAQRRDDDRRIDRDDRRGDEGRRRDRGWELLGEKRVGFRVDHDAIDLAQSEDWYRDRRYRALHFLAEDNDIHMINVRLVYFNGHREDFRVDRPIREREEMQMDLRGERGFLRRIEMTYRSRPDVRGQATIKVYGEPARRGPPDVVVGWQELDRQRFDRTEERVVLRVGRDDGRLGQIRLRAIDDRVHLREIRIRFRNDERQTVEIDQSLEAGEETRAIDLEGDQRRVEEVVVSMRAGRRPGMAGLALLGTSRAGRPDDSADRADRGDWVELGCKQVALIGRDRDTVPVGRREGRFKAIRLHVTGADVEMLDLKVIYANGDPDDIPVRNLIRADSRTRRMELRGYERSIRQVDLVYRTALNPVDILARQRLSQARVCVEGLQ